MTAKDHNNLNTIVITGARMHNLKNVNLTLPRNKLIVFTGLSGSGKSSLAFDTIYAEGQRRYVESLSAYARQFLNQLDKPAVDRIEGLSPAISIDQKNPSHNPRSTVGTVTEIYDYLRVLYSSIGVPHCPVCEAVVQSQSIQEITNAIMASATDALTVMIQAPLIQDKKGSFTKEINQWKSDGFLRVCVNNKIVKLADMPALNKSKKHTISIIVDRLTLSQANQSRLFEAVEKAAQYAGGLVEVVWPSRNDRQLFSEQFSCPGCQVSLPDISPRLFSFNSPIGACLDCRGLGFKLQFDPLLIFPDSSKILRLATAHCLDLNRTNDGHQAEKMCRRHQFSLSTPVCDLTPGQRHIILYGHKNTRTIWPGIIPRMTEKYHQVNRSLYRQFYEQFMTDQACPRCKGSRLKPEALAVKLSQASITDLTNKSLDNLAAFFESLALSDGDQHVVAEVVTEIKTRVAFLRRVGLGYLTLARQAGTLSGGEYQRIRLATQIGSGLTGVLYVLDEPSIGLHQRDNQRLINALFRLRDLGNTLIVVEHDEDMIRSADYVVDIGPAAGRYGGEILFSGTVNKLKTSKQSVTSPYIFGDKIIPVPDKRRPVTDSIVLAGACANNIQALDVSIPLGIFTCVTGVSGSGKSTLIHTILTPALLNYVNKLPLQSRFYTTIDGLDTIDKVIIIDQSPIGRTPRSNPATYTGLFTPLRELMTQTKAAKLRGYKPGRFSFNVRGGRCESCQGDGSVKIEMHFLADVYVTCDVCQGSRYNQETLQIKFDGHTIADFLAMTVKQALESCLKDVPAIASRLETLNDVGLGYVQLGQSATTLSGGEAQRIKLAKELSRPHTGNTVYLLDEPTTGLHFHDIQNLLIIIQRLVDRGNTVIVIEHNLDVIKSADHVIDLGPDGGDKGGQLVATGTPESVAKTAADTGSETGRFLEPLLNAS